MTEVHVSALLPVHAGVDSEHLARALASLAEQTAPPDEVVVVEDGPLPEAHHAVLRAFEAAHPRVLRVPLSHNQGAGVANQAGLEAASGTWIAKADADDISVPHRIRTQLDALEAAAADVCGATMLEFVGGPDDVVSVRRMPRTHRAIGRRMRWNNPVNHPTALYRREAALRAGGYPPWRHMQDYGLVARLYASGAVMMNLDDALVLFRSSPSVTARRRSATVRRLEVELQRELRRLGLVGPHHVALNLAWRTTYRVAPASLVEVANRRLLARPVDRQ